MCSCIFITHPHTSWRVMYEITFSINRAYSRSTTTYLVLPRSPIAHHLQCEQYNCFGVMGSLPFVYSSQAVSRSYFPHSRSLRSAQTLHMQRWSPDTPLALCQSMRCHAMHAWYIIWLSFTDIIENFRCPIEWNIIYVDSVCVCVFPRLSCCCCYRVHNSGEYSHILAHIEQTDER